MCVPGCHETVIQRLHRRRLLGAGGAALAAGALASPSRAAAQTRRSFERVVDLTHRLDADFPTFSGERQLEVERILSYGADGYNMARWSLVEHVGTHLDAPIHFSRSGASADELPVDRLVAPLAVVDLRAKAAEDADARLTVEDLVAFEARHGPIPAGACVAMNSGWADRVGGAGFRNADADGVMHFPGFDEEAARWLMEEREVVGLAVDTLSLDHGASRDFAVHYAWLPTNRCGLEAVAALDALPARGATLVVGAPKIAAATGGPSRIMALV